MVAQKMRSVILGYMQDITLELDAKYGITPHPLSPLLLLSPQSPLSSTTAAPFPSHHPFSSL